MNNIFYYKTKNIFLLLFIFSLTNSPLHLNAEYLAEYLIDIDINNKSYKIKNKSSSIKNDLRKNPLDNFSIIMMPDTQNYTRTKENFKHFEGQLDWIINNKSKEKIVFISHVGDLISNKKISSRYALLNKKPFCPILKHFNSKYITDQYKKASNILKKLEDNSISFSVVPGNHDYDCLMPPSTFNDTTYFRKFFGVNKYKDKSWFIDSDKTERNMAQKFESNGKEFIHIGLEQYPSDKAILFAQEVITNHPKKPVIITTHSHLKPGENNELSSYQPLSPNSSGINDPLQLFKKLIEPFPQVFLVLSGHYHGNGYLAKESILKKSTHQILANYQFDPGGGNGWLNILKFKPKDSVIEVKVISQSYRPNIDKGPDRSKDKFSNFTISHNIIGLRNYLNSHEIKHFRKGQLLESGDKYKNVKDKYIINKNKLLFISKKSNNINNLSLKKDELNLKNKIKITFKKISYILDSFARSLINKEDIFINNSDFKTQGLIKFENTIGFSKNQIPPNTKIEKAILTITAEGQGANPGDVFIYKMNSYWDETSEWNDFGDGIKIGQHTNAKPDGIIKSNTFGTNSYDITKNVQEWVNGEKNNGWVFISKNMENWGFRSSDWRGITERPMLTVIYKK